MGNMLKWLGLAPAAGGALSNLWDLEFLKKLDLLHGLWGAAPHLVGIAIFVVARWRAVKRNATIPAADAERSRARFASFALALIIVCVALSFASIPDSAPQWLILWRWKLAALVYLAFYACLGLSEPEL